MLKTSLNTIQTIITDLGVSKNDHIMIHADLRCFGLIEGGGQELISMISNLVEDGVLVTPAFTFSFPEIFDINQSMPKVGALSNLFHREENKSRLADGMTSYYFLGKESEHYISSWGHTSYGINSIPDLMLKKSGKVLQLGTDVMSLIHYLEEVVKVPYREVKRFEGIIKNGNEMFKSYTDFYARILPVSKIIPDPIRKAFFKNLDNTIFFKNKPMKLFLIEEFMQFSKPLLQENKYILVNEE